MDVSETFEVGRVESNRMCDAVNLERRREPRIVRILAEYGVSRDQSPPFCVKRHIVGGHSKDAFKLDETGFCFPEHLSPNRSLLLVW